MQFKPYPEYKYSGFEWLGEVPEHWDIFKSDKIFEQSNIRAFEYDVQLTASQKYGVIPQNLYMQKEESKVVLALSGINNFKHVDQNDFVISLRSFQGGIELCHYEGCVSPAYTVLKNKKNIDQIFWSYLLKSNIYVSVLNTAVDGIREGKTISYANFGKIYINFPSLNEQNKIASFLNQETTKIDLLISKQEKLIELLEEQRKSIISHAVTKGLNPDAPMKDSGVEWLGKVPAHWSAIPIKYLANINTEVLAESTDYNYDIQYVDISGVSEKEGISHRETVEFGNAPSRARRIVKDGDIIISTVRTYLRAIAYIKNPPSNMIVSTGFAVITPLRKILSSQFAKYAFLADAFLDEVISKSKGVSYPAITTTELADIAIMVPNLIEQTEIAKYLDQEISKIDTTIDKQKQLVENLKEYRSSIISHAVTGKVDVRDLAA